MLPVRYYRSYPPNQPFGETHAYLPIEMDRCALLLVDVFSTTPTASTTSLLFSSSEKKQEEVSAAYIQPLLLSARAAQLPVIFVANSVPNIELGRSVQGFVMREHHGTDHVAKFAENKGDPLEYLSADSPCLSYEASVAPRAGEYYVRKYTFGAFFDGRLDTLLRDLDVEVLIVAGFATDACLQATAMGAFDRNYLPVLVRDATFAVELPDDGPQGTFTRRAIRWFECHLGPSATTGDVIRLCSEKLSPGKSVQSGA